MLFEVDVDRSDTVWYDSVELIRPDKERGWDGLIEGVAKRLSALDDAALKESEIVYLKRALGTMMRANRPRQDEARQVAGFPDCL